MFNRFSIVLFREGIVGDGGYQYWLRISMKLTCPDGFNDIVDSAQQGQDLTRERHGIAY